MLLAVLIVLSTSVSVFAENSTNTTEQTKEVSITEALADAKAGETSTLSADTEASVVVVPENVTLDLNGYKLKADYMACYGVLVDQSESNNGLLAVNANRFYIREDNAQLPVKTKEGYKFFEVTKFNKKFKDAESKYIFQPFVEEGAHEFLKKGAEASGVTINVRLSWNAGNSGKRSQDFVYSDEFVKNFLTAMFHQQENMIDSLRLR